MTFPVRLRSEAEEDLEDAARWYEGQKRGLGQQFLDEVTRTYWRDGRATHYVSGGWPWVASCVDPPLSIRDLLPDRGNLAHSYRGHAWQQASTSLEVKNMTIRPDGHTKGRASLDSGTRPPVRFFVFWYSDSGACHG